MFINMCLYIYIYICVCVCLVESLHWAQVIVLECILKHEPEKATSFESPRRAGDLC